MAEKNGKVGERVRSLRLAKGLSIADVSAKSGISESTLYGIESHLVTPPLGNIVSLAKVFGVSLADFFGDSGDSPFCITRRVDRKPVSRFNSTDTKTGGYSYESLGQQKKNRQMEPFLVTLTPTDVSLLEPNQHIGEEIIFVLEGKVEIRILDHIDILETGDSIYYDSTVPHIVSCHGNEPATILAVIYAKDEMMIF